MMESCMNADSPCIQVNVNISLTAALLCLQSSGDA